MELQNKKNMENGNQIVKSINSTNLTLEQVEIGINTIERMHQKSLEFQLECKQIELQIYQVDKQFDALIANMEYDLNRTIENKDVVLKALDMLNASMTKTLDKVLEMDDGDIESKMKIKFALIETMNKNIDGIVGIILKFL